MTKSFALNTSIPVIDAQSGQVGDAVFCHSTGTIGKAIRLGQRLHGFAPEYRVWNHIAWLDEPIYKNGQIVDWHVGQAIGKGVDNKHLLSSVAPGGHYEIVSMDSFPTIDGKPLNRDRVVETLRAEVGQEYGYLTIAAEVFNIVTPEVINLDFRKDGTWICSGLYAYGLHAGGGKIQGDIYHVMPAGIARLASGTAFG